VLAIRTRCCIEDLPVGDLPLSPAPLAATVAEARDFIAEVVPVRRARRSPVRPGGR